MAAGNGLRTIPPVRVNLLPPEVSVRRQAQQVQVGAIAAVAAVLVVVVMLYLVESSRLSTAEKDLERAIEQERVLKSRAAELVNVENLSKTKDNREVVLTAAMGPEVRFSTLLRTLQRGLPDRVWISNLTIVISLGATAATQGGIQFEQVGTITLTGVSASPNADDIAAFLDLMAQPTGFSFPYVQTIVDAQPASVNPTLYNFTASIQLNSAARSQRFAQPGGPAS